MKISAAILILSAVIIMSCNDPKQQIVLKGKWKLIETLMDPGDGSGQFEKTSYEWSLEFLADGAVKSSHALCMDNSSHTGTYTEKEIKGAGCDPVYGYKLDGKYLIVTHKLCIEPCAYKFIKSDMPSDL